MVEELIAPPPGEQAPPPEAEETPEMPVDAPSTFTGRRKVAVGVASAGVLALGAGILLGIQSKGLEDEAYAACPSNPCGGTAAEASSLVDRAQQRAVFANVSFGIAIAAAAGAVVLWFTGTPDPESSETALVPAVTPTTATLAIVGRF